VAYAIIKDKVFWLLFILASIYILGNIGTGSLTTWDEAIYANITGNMLKTSDWLIMHDNGKAWFDKPPLYMWCAAFFYNIFGINEFSTRLTSGIFGIATVMLIYIFVKRTGNVSAALLASLLLAASPHFLHYSKMGMMDVMLTFFITLMLLLFWEGQKDDSYLLWSGTILFFAYMAKGFAAAAGPAAIFLYCLFSGNLRLLVKRQFVIGILISAAGILTWHIVQYVYGGQGAIDNYFGFHIFKRTFSALEGHTGGLNFYQKAIFNKNRPWAVIFYGSMVYMLWLIIDQKDRRAIFTVSWAAAVFIICSIVRTKLHWYIVPIYPALAISSGIFLEAFFRNKAFYIILSVILAGMLIQVPLSWAFKLDLNPEVKKAAACSKKLSYRDNGTIFYYETVMLKPKGGI